MMQRSFDLAPHAPRNTPASWLALAVTAALASWAAVGATTSLLEWQGANDTAQTQRVETRKRRTADAERARDSAAVDAARKVGQQLENRLNLPWSGIFVALEAAARESGGEAVLMAMRTSTPSETGPQVNLNCVASSPAAMLKYVRALRVQVGAGNVRLVSQEKALAAGPDGVSFQLNVNWVAP